MASLPEHDAVGQVHAPEDLQGTPGVHEREVHCLVQAGFGEGALNVLKERTSRQGGEGLLRFSASDHHLPLPVEDGFEHVLQDLDLHIPRMIIAPRYDLAGLVQPLNEPDVDRVIYERSPRNGPSNGHIRSPPPIGRRTCRKNRLRTRIHVLGRASPETRLSPDGRLNQHMTRCRFLSTSLLLGIDIHRDSSRMYHGRIRQATMEPQWFQ